MSIILFFGILLLLVLVHEFGHFIVAKKSGIRVDEFAFGFPPRLFSVKKGETTYAFNALPIGGYVKIYGEDPNEVATEDASRSFSAQPKIIQAGVIVAGVAFNLLLAWALLSLTLMVGIPASQESATPYTISTPKLVVTQLSPDSPSASSGLRAGDTLRSVSDGEESIIVTTPESVSQFVAARAGRPITFSALRGGEEKSFVITPVTGIVPGRAAIGIYMDMVGTLKLSFFDAVKYGAVKTYEYTILTAVGLYDFLKMAVVGRADFTQVTGPVGIVGAVGSAATLGVANLLLFTALISINLAVINVLPFPALDGGRLLFVIIESITRRKIKPVVANTMNFVGFGLLMFFMVLVTYHDVIRLFK